MKKIIAMFCLCACAAAVVSAQASRGGTMYVATKTLNLKSSTGFFASTRGSLDYGAQVTVLQVNGSWVEVRSAAKSSVSGWAKTASLTSRRILEGSTTSATAQEVALAGKGFNQEIENSYRSGGNLNYADVDRTEAQQVGDEELRSFLVEGRLSLGER
ncbi:MAG: hypothetical protein LBQ69_00450 [Treponema sp.]|jgi:uncharacterized protein YgiM (DUF1202 family)|nr:hypothetical protein [Treponema sp.]